MAAPTYINKATAVASTLASDDIAYMGSIVAGDLLLLNVISWQVVGGSIGDINTPAGWTLLGGGVGWRNSALANAGTGKVFYKIADGTEAGLVTVTRTGSTGATDPMYMQMYQFRGLVLAIESTSSNITGDGNATVTWNSVAVNGNERTLIALCGQTNTAPGTPAGYTRQATDVSGGVLLSLTVDVKENVTSDGLITATGGESDGWFTVHASIFNVRGRSFIVN